MESDIQSLAVELRSLRESMQQTEKHLVEKIDNLSETLKAQQSENGGAHEKIRGDIKEHYVTLENHAKQLIVVENKADRAHERIDELINSKRDETGTERWSKEMKIIVASILTTAIISIAGIVVTIILNVT